MSLADPSAGFGNAVSGGQDGEVVFAGEQLDAMPDGPELSEDDLAESAAEAAARGAEAAAAGAAAAAEAAAEAIQAQISVGSIYWSRPGWRVSVAEHHCYLTNLSLSVSYDDRLRRTEVSFVDASIKSLKLGERRHGNLHWLDSQQGGVGGEALIMTAQPVPEDAPDFTIMSARVSPDFLDRFGRMSTLGVFTGDSVLIKSWSLAGSAVAVSRLRECSREVAFQRPSDPFAK